MESDDTGKGTGIELEKSDDSGWLNEQTKQQLAHIAQLKAQQNAAQRNRKKDEDERRKRRDEQKRKRRMIDLAFDGDIDKIEALLSEIMACDDEDELTEDGIGGILRRRHIYEIIECEDMYGNKPISEAASGGQCDTIRYLVERGANPNSQGHYGRTPLYRASFAGHVDAIKVLLELGADPRIHADDGHTAMEETFSKCTIFGSDSGKTQHGYGTAGHSFMAGLQMYSQSHD